MGNLIKEYKIIPPHWLKPFQETEREQLLRDIERTGLIVEVLHYTQWDFVLDKNYFQKDDVVGYKWLDELVPAYLITNSGEMYYREGISGWRYNFELVSGIKNMPVKGLKLYKCFSTTTDGA